MEKSKKFYWKAKCSKRQRLCNLYFPFPSFPASILVFCLLSMFNFLTVYYNSWMKCWLAFGSQASDIGTSHQHNTKTHSSLGHVYHWTNLCFFHGYFIGKSTKCSLILMVDKSKISSSLGTATCLKNKQTNKQTYHESLCCLVVYFISPLWNWSRAVAVNGMVYW